MINQQHTFTEKQRFMQGWLWSVLIAFALFLLLTLVHRFAYQASQNETSLAVLVGLAVFHLAFMFFFWMLSLRTEIDAEAIRFQFFPFLSKEIEWAEVKRAELLNYGFVGGWGIRLGSSYGTVYNVRGNKGLAIELNSGKRLLIGTQNEQELSRFLTQLKTLGVQSSIRASIKA